MNVLSCFHVSDLRCGQTQLRLKIQCWFLHLPHAFAEWKFPCDAIVWGCSRSNPLMNIITYRKESLFRVRVWRICLSETWRGSCMRLPDPIAASVWKTGHMELQLHSMPDPIAASEWKKPDIWNDSLGSCDCETGFWSRHEPLALFINSI